MKTKNKTPSSNRHMATLLATMALGEPYAWQASSTSYYYESVAGEPYTCCGSYLVGDPAASIQPYNCPTDVTAGLCDTGSCCDPDCSAGSLATVDGVFGCPIAETPFSRSNVLYCSDAIPLSVVNLPAAARADGWATTTEFNELLCVYKDNSPSLGSFYSDPTTGGLTGQQVTNEIEAAIGSAFSDSLGGPPPTDVSAKLYRLGEPVLGEGCASAGGSSGCTSLAPLLLPAVAADGTCAAHGRSVPYLRELEPYSCAPTASSSLVELCASQYAAQKVTSLNRGSAPVLAAAPNLGLQLPVDILYRYSDGDNFGRSGSVPQAGYDVSSAVCLNALVGLQWRFVASDEGTIAAATAYVDLRSLTAPTAQTFAASFELSSEADTVGEARPVSGRPGYLRGLPLLVADGTPPAFGESGSLKLRMQPTALLSRNPAGACDFDSTGGLPSLLTFGDEVAASCVQSFRSVDELRAWCELSPALPSVPALRPLNLTWGRDALAWVGKFGDAHPDAAADWTPLRLAAGSGGLSRSWDASRLQCDGVISSVEVQLLFLEVGALLAPAKKVAGAQLKLGTRSVRASRCPLGQPAAAPCVTRYALTAATRFVRLMDGQSVEAFVPPMPQIFPAFPADILYPFFRPAAAEDSSRRMLHEVEPSSGMWAMAALPACILVVGVAARRHRMS
jgi:hypothetical protein